MNNTLSTPDPAAQVAQVRAIIEGRTFMHSCESTLLAIRRVILPPPDEIEPLERDQGGKWPKLHPSDPPGTAWERHDDPTMHD